MSNLIDSGVQWIGKIPKDWKLIHFKNKYRNKKEIAGSRASDYERIALTLNGVIKRPKDDSEGLQPKDFDTYQILEANDFVFKMIDLQNISTSRVGLSPYTGLVSPAYLRFSPKDPSENTRFMHYYLMSLYYNCVFNSLGGDGVRSSLSAKDMGQIMCPYPNVSIQQKIVEFLDKKSSQIDELIAIQEQEIEKLQAYKHSLITEVVTKGLDPNVEMKDSGVEWIGITPKHWEVKQLRYIANDFQKGSGITKEDIINDGDINCVRYADLYTDYSYNFKDCKIKTNLALHTSPKYFSYGDLLFTCTGELVEEIGKSASYLGHEKCLAGGDIIICRHSQNPTFMGYALGSLYCQMQKSYGKRKLKVVHISLSEIKNIFVTLPSLEEQNQIGEFLNQKCLHIDELIELKNNKIDQLHNYKKSLIYEYVTGKKEV